MNAGVYTIAFRILTPSCDLGLFMLRRWLQLLQHGTCTHDTPATGDAGLRRADVCCAASARFVNIAENARCSVIVSGESRMK